MRIIKYSLLFMLLWLPACVPISQFSLDAQHQALILVDRGTALLRENSLDEAQAAFSVAYDLAALPQAVDGMGCVAFLRGDPVTAERLFKRAFDLDHGYSDGLANLGQLYDLQGRTAAARLLYERVLAYDPVNVRARNNYAALLYDEHEPGLSRLELLRAQAVARHPMLDSNLKRMDSGDEIH